MSPFYPMLLAALDRGEPCALAIITSVKGSSPQKQGAKALFYADGRIEGTLGGGCLEAEIQQRARRTLASGVPESFELVLDHDFGWDDGLICGGKVFGLILPRVSENRDLWAELVRQEKVITWGVRPDFSIGHVVGAEQKWVYQETVSPRCALWIAGAGHVAQAVAPLALQLEFDVTVFDDRPAMAAPERFPPGTRLQADYWDKLLAEPMPPWPVFGLIVTRGHQHDALVLRTWVHQPFIFLGMIGSSRKKRLIFNQFLEENLATEEELTRVACPVGLDLLAVGVNEIALSIVAQYVRARAEKVHGRVPKSASTAPPAAVYLAANRQDSLD
jgi:xanthine dehydrogenase accessory factor